MTGERDGVLASPPIEPGETIDMGKADRYEGIRMVGLLYCCRSRWDNGDNDSTIASRQTAEAGDVEV